MPEVVDIELEDEESVDKEEDQNIFGRSEPKKIDKSKYIRWLLAMCFIWIAVAFYGETEGQWFNAFVTNDVIGTGYSNTQMSYMVSTSAIMGTIAFIFWASISDNLRTKLGRRIPIYVGGAVLTAVFVLLFGVSTNLIWLIVCDGIIIGFTSNMFHCTSRALIPDLFPKHKRGHVNFYMQIASGIGGLSIWGLAFLFKAQNGGDSSYKLSQFYVVFSICAALLVISAIAVVFLIKEPKIKTEARKWTHDIALMFNKEEMSQHTNFLKLFIASLFVIMSSNAYKPWMLKMLEMIEFPTEFWQIAVGGCIAAAIALPVIFKFSNVIDRLGRKKAMRIALIFIPVGCIIMVLSNYNFFLIIVGLATIISFTIGLDVALQTWTQDLLPPESRAKFLGIINIGRAAGQVPGVMLAGVIADAFGELYIFLISALFLLVAIPLFERVPETLDQ